MARGARGPENSVRGKSEKRGGSRLKQRSSCGSGAHVAATVVQNYCVHVVAVCAGTGAVLDMLWCRIIRIGDWWVAAAALAVAAAR